MTYYTNDAVRTLIERYQDEGGDIVEVREGVLGFGTTVCTGVEGWKTAIIEEHYATSQSSVHSIRLWNKIPKKYAALIDAYYAREEAGEDMGTPAYAYAYAY